ncbi:hypothetical protein KQX54_011020 [Cotesia glomerata]|uniref:Uncharacterized protein n=1 Tax=Cotesia glomerata TaxID=32391 RepID=A0AAV7INJ0_COTGL|nr:hypothetical protein KQX54_011020 [Cotesia glomerata]
MEPSEMWLKVGVKHNQSPVTDHVPSARVSFCLHVTSVATRNEPATRDPRPMERLLSQKLTNYRADCRGDQLPAVHGVYPCKKAPNIQ